MENVAHDPRCYLYECWTFDHTVCHPSCPLRGTGVNPEDWYTPRQVAFRRKLARDKVTNQSREDAA